MDKEEDTDMIGIIVASNPGRGTGSRIDILVNKDRQGVYISGTPIWYAGRDPLNFGSMTPI
jgi:hypothetical protein